MMFDASTARDDGAEHVVEFGDDREPRRAPFAALLSGRPLPGDRRILLGAGALGVALCFVSLLQVWQHISIRESQGTVEPVTELTERVGSMGAWGAGFLIGVFGMLMLGAIVLFGPPSARQLCRVMGLALAGGTGGMLIALLLHSEPVSFTFGVDLRMETTPGPGPMLALAGVAAFGVMFFQIAKEYEAPYPEPVAATAAPAETPEPESTVWRPELPPIQGGPVDLTVSPTTPFMNPPDPYRGR